VLRSLENQITGSLTLRSSSFLESLRRRYAPKKKPVLKPKKGKSDQKPNGKSVKKDDQKVDDDRTSVDSMLSDDDQNGDSKTDSEQKPKVDPAVLPKIAQSQAILEALVNEQRDLVLQGLCSRPNFQ